MTEGWREPRLMNTPQVFAAAVGCLVLCSCASVSVKDIKRTTAVQPTRKPQRIAIVAFTAERSVATENVFRKKKGELNAEGAAILNNYLVKELSRTVAPASLDANGKGDVWLVSGRITRIAEGSRLLRVGIGLGLGGTKMETVVEVRNASRTNAPFLRFATTGGSNATPGAATSPVPFSAAPTALLQAQRGVTDDAARTARMISATIATYMVQRGWLDAANVQPPKLYRQ